MAKKRRKETFKKLHQVVFEFFLRVKFDDLIDKQYVYLKKKIRLIKTMNEV